MLSGSSFIGKRFDVITHNPGALIGMDTGGVRREKDCGSDI
jgi:hypothetical protein